MGEQGGGVAVDAEVAAENEVLARAGPFVDSLHHGSSAAEDQRPVTDSRLKPGGTIGDRQVILERRLVGDGVSNRESGTAEPIRQRAVGEEHGILAVHPRKVDQVGHRRSVPRAREPQCRSCSWPTRASARYAPSMPTPIATGTPVFSHPPVSGRLVAAEGPDDVLDLLAEGAEGVIVLVRDAGATFLSPIFPELAGVICTAGTPASHVGIVSREFQVPCVMGMVFDGDVPPNHTEVVLDCTSSPAILALAVEHAATDHHGITDDDDDGDDGDDGDQRPRPMAVGFGRVSRPPVPPELLIRSGPALSAGDRLREADRLVRYHEPITRQLTFERTSYHSQLIPVTPYILVACAETFYRYPDMMRTIDAAMPAEEIVRAGRHPGSRINAVHLWSIANFWLTGRKVITTMDPSLDDPEAAYTVLDFWERGAAAFRGNDGTLQAWDADDVLTPYGPDVIDALLAGVVPVADDTLRGRIKRFNATLRNYLFLLYFDTRIGTGDTGPYLLPDGRVLLVRDFYQLGQSEYWWSDVAADLPYQHLVAALVLDGVDAHVTDFGSTVTDPEDYLDRLVGFGLFTTDGGGADRTLHRVDLSGLDAMADAINAVNARHYRNVVNMTRDERIRCGAYVYFGFLKPFAEVAGVADQMDWSVPVRTEGFLYDVLSAMDGDLLPALDPDARYYEPLVPGP